MDSETTTKIVSICNFLTYSLTGGLRLIRAFIHIDNIHNMTIHRTTFIAGLFK